MVCSKGTVGTPYRFEYRDFWVGTDVGGSWQKTQSQTASLKLSSRQTRRFFVNDDADHAIKSRQRRRSSRLDWLSQRLFPS